MKKIDEAQDEPCKKHDVRLTFRLARIARKLGKGNLSAGIRLALERTGGNDTYMGDVTTVIHSLPCDED